MNSGFYLLIAAVAIFAAIVTGSKILVK